MRSSGIAFPYIEWALVPAVRVRFIHASLAFGSFKASLSSVIHVNPKK